MERWVQYGALGVLVLLVAWASVAFAQPANAPDVAGHVRIRCADFRTRAEAQAWWEAHRGDAAFSARLDADSDGQVCEGLS